MRFSTCKKCGAQVSEQASVCPSCGSKQPKKIPPMAWAFLAFIVLFLIRMGCSYSERGTPVAAPAENHAAESAQKAAKKAADDRRAREFEWILKGKESVKAKLKDPDSAQFREVFFYHAKDGIPATCGQVNSKNSFGGYGGFQRFLSAGSAELTFLEEEVSDFSAVWNKFCSGEKK